MTLTKQRYLFVFCVKMYLPRIDIGSHFKFGGHFKFYIIYYKSEAFLRSNKPFLDNFIVL